MFKLIVFLSPLLFLGYSWTANFKLPRLTEGPADFFLIPFLGYLSIILVAQLTARLPTRKATNR